MALQLNISYDADNASERLNKRLSGIIPHGVQQEFLPSPVSGESAILITKGERDISAAAVHFEEFALGVTDKEDSRIEVSPTSEEMTKLIVSEAKYRWGLTSGDQPGLNQAAYRLIDANEKRPYHIEVCRVTIPANEPDSRNWRIDTSSRDAAATTPGNFDEIEALKNRAPSPATTTQRGIVRRATDTEATAGVNADTAITPSFASVHASRY